MKAKQQKPWRRIVPLVLLLICLMMTEITSEAAPKLSKKKLTLQRGEIVTLYVTGTKSKVTWTSSNKKVATVTKKGKVKTKAVGKTKITAKVAGKKLTCTLTVKKAVSKASSAATKRYDAGEYSIGNVQSGEATYYVRTSTGCANLDYLDEDYYTVAMNREDYENGLAGAYIQITDKDGDKIKAYVTDMLPEGKKGDIDLTKKTFTKIEPLVTGRMPVTWTIIPTQTTQPIAYRWKDGSSKWWSQVQVINGRYPIRSLEVFDKKTRKYVKLTRQTHNYFSMPEGIGGGPFKFRVTDFYGHVLIDPKIKMNTTGIPVEGKKNFPY